MQRYHHYHMSENDLDVVDMIFVWQISHCLGEILGICHSFCGLYQHADIDLTEQESRQLEQLTKVGTRRLKNNRQLFVKMFIKLAIYYSIFFFNYTTNNVRLTSEHSVPEEGRRWWAKRRSKSNIASCVIMIFFLRIIDNKSKDFISKINCCFTLNFSNI